MNMSYLLKQEEIEDYRISIYQDEDADELIEKVLRENGIQGKDAA